MTRDEKSTAVYSQNLTVPETGVLLTDSSKKLLGVQSIKLFLKIADDIISKIEESKRCLEKIQEAQKLVHDHAVLLDHTVKKNRLVLETETAKLMEYLNRIRQNINMIEPSKPNLSNLDIRNKKFKFVLKPYKHLLEEFISMTLESQRFASLLFENQIKSVNPDATPFDLERAMSSTNDDFPSVFVQVLMQRGARKNDRGLQRTMKAVQDISQDLRQLNITFAKISELRNETNIIIERYRQRWPVFLKEDKYIYIIDDNLDLLERAAVGITIDFEEILRQREKRNRTTMILIGAAAIAVIVSLIVFTTMFSDF